MLITPRAEEVNQVVAILESGEFSGPEPMAKALIKQIADILSYREWWVLTHRFGNGQVGVNWAPFASQNEALKTAHRIALNGKFSAIKLHSSGALLANLTSSRRKGWCQVDGCGHADWVHLMNGTTRGKCGLESCPCTAYQK
ncbi:hypothetical protein AB0J80_35905 [Actinoplanes sp. NPDC049548]|uniref:hypothetical protein n=1 Tax=Actinoplanes sp. NPDC049548 TaxID=3155152 RepID=UPI0034441E9D